MSLERSSAPVTETNKMTPTEKWKLLFSTLLNVPVNDLDLAADINKETLLLTTTNRAISEKIIATLNSPESIRANLSYTLTEIASNTQQPVPLTQPVFYPPAITLEHGKGAEIYKQLFGEKAIRLLGAIDWSAAELPREDCFILTAEQDPDYQNNNIDTYKKILCGATFADLRYALSSDPIYYKPLPYRKNTDGVLAKHIDKIFYASNDNKTTLLDYGLLVNCVNSPAQEISLVNADEDKFQISINIQHLINYLSITFPEKFVLSLSGNPDAPQQATPITFNIKRTVGLKNIISLILDCSGSMDYYKQAYIEQVKNFVVKLSEQADYQDATIRIINFSSQNILNEFKLKDIPRILHHLDKLEMDGDTHLNAAIHNELSTLLKNSKDNENVTVVIFTDGNDNDSNPDIKDNLKNTAEKINQKQGSRPRIFAMGLGRIEESKLTQLATLTGGAFIKLVTIDDFKNILDHLEEMGRIKEFMTFVQENTTFVTPSYIDDINVATQSLQVPGSFMVADKQYQVTQGSLQLEDISKPNVSRFIANLTESDAANLLKLLNQRKNLESLSAPGQNGIFKLSPEVAITPPVPAHTIGFGNT